MSNVFKYCNHVQDLFLIGTYRSDKKHLSWIVGEEPIRNSLLYNVRHNEGLFSTRDGGICTLNKPNYILLYNLEVTNEAPRLFTCTGVKQLTEDDMRVLRYPDPEGDYIVYNLGEELEAQNVIMEDLLKAYRTEHPSHIIGEPFFLKGEKVFAFADLNINKKTIHKSMSKQAYKSIDLFAGIGGIRRGFDNAFGEQIETVFVSEWDKPATETYKANYPSDPFEIAGDITAVDESTIDPFDICLAGFPCQAFSMAGKRQGFNDDYKGRCRGTLFLDVARICEYHNPKVIFCENVKGLTIHDKGNTFRVICETFENLGKHGYKVFAKVLNSKNFGVPQQRERIYIVCFRKDIAPETFEFPEGSMEKVCIRDILDPAPVPSKYYLSETYLNTLKAHRARHEAAGHGFGYVVRDLDGISGTIVCGGMGREANLIKDEREHSMEPSTHIKGEINKESIRKMTPREWARLQGYPESFVLKLSDVHLYKQFGNSVSVPVIEAIAKEIKKVLDVNDK